MPLASDVCVFGFGSNITSNLSHVQSTGSIISCRWSLHDFNCVYVFFACVLQQRRLARGACSSRLSHATRGRLLLSAAFRVIIPQSFVYGLFATLVLSQVLCQPPFNHHQFFLFCHNNSAPLASTTRSYTCC